MTVTPEPANLIIRSSTSAVTVIPESDVPVSGTVPNSSITNETVDKLLTSEPSLDKGQGNTPNRESSTSPTLLEASDLSSSTSGNQFNDSKNPIIKNVCQWKQIKSKYIFTSGSIKTLGDGDLGSAKSTTKINLELTTSSYTTSQTLDLAGSNVIEGDLVPGTSSTLKYPVTFTTTSTKPSPAPWPYPTSTTTQTVPSNGACLFDSRVYMSAQQIPRDDPCDFCFCFRGDIICLQQSCPPPIPGCYEQPIPGFCCPRYECPVGNSNSTMAPLFPPSYYHNQVLNNAQPSSAPAAIGASSPGCEIQGEYYEAGQVVTATSGPCLECR